MNSPGTKANGREAAPKQAVPSLSPISLPKGGGAVRGIGEKFAANPVTGTCSVTVPIVTSPGRAGFEPQLTLSYDSGSGNGPFGLGWSLSLPQITRKTDKGLPRYCDAEESDVFILSGAEDLAPALVETGGGWKYDSFSRTVNGVEYNIDRYRPRVEGLFARIERWTRSDGDVHWRSISRDNILTLYGKDDNSRIVIPGDRHVFSWLISETRDGKGNVILFEYKPEDGTGIDLTQAHERNRGGRDDPRRAANRYLKYIRYGNRVPLLDNAGKRPLFLSNDAIQNAGWLFEVVFDYGEHDMDAPKPRDAGRWTRRVDPFSSYRPGFEVRTCRLCRRVLVFHHFAGEPDIGNDCLVRSTDFTYSPEQDPAHTCAPVYSFLHSVTQSGYKRRNCGYLKQSLPPVEFEYSKPVVQENVQEVDAGYLENLPAGLDDAAYRWTDLHGEGISGILTEQGETWYYKRNLSPVNLKPGDGPACSAAKFAPVEPVAARPNLSLNGGQAQFMDLAGDGRPDLVVLDGPAPGFYEHDGDKGWDPFRPFASRLNRDMRDPNLKFIDLDGDGHADLLISEDNVFVWHPSLGEEGFGPGRRVAQAADEEKGPRLVFADSAQSVYLADMSGDGLTDLVRIRNGEVCYWPNLGYGRFGAKITMDNAPLFDLPEQFDRKRLLPADIDGTGAVDLIYLHRDGVRLYFNQSGNSWSAPQILKAFPRIDDPAGVTPVDLLGNGTACLVWSSPLPGDARRQMRYVDLMGGQKPHLLVKTANNLGAETRLRYAPSTKFYLQDKQDGRPWITRLPFPVHVLERVETYDYISRNRFVTRYAYHHGYFDGVEREFRGFGLVEQWDTEEFAALSGGGHFPAGANIEPSSHTPPVWTRTWFHTGAYLERDHISNFFAGLRHAGDTGEYYREPGLTGAQARALLLEDTLLPPGLTLEEEREACRALKGAVLRREVYALDGTPKAQHPYTVTEQNYTIRRLQPRGRNRHASFFTHPREAVEYHYECNPADPRVSHSLTLEVDRFGNVLKEATVAYGRREKIHIVDDARAPGAVTEVSHPALAKLDPPDREKQTTTLITYTENRVTEPVDDSAVYPDDYYAPLPCETRVYEITGVRPENNATRFSFAEWTRDNFALPASAAEIPYEQAADHSLLQKRLIEHVRILYRPDDLGAAQNNPFALLPLGTMEPLALPGETYKLAFTPGLLSQVFRRPKDGSPPEHLLPDPAGVLSGRGPGQGGYVSSQTLRSQNLFPAGNGDPLRTRSDTDNHWWVPAGRFFLSPAAAHSAAEEAAYARCHFFRPCRFQDPFGQTTTTVYDQYDLLVLETCDPLGNRITAGERDPEPTRPPVKKGLDYRVLQPRLVMDANRNRSAVVFNALGMVTASAVMGKPEDTPQQGDFLAPSFSDLSEMAIDSFYNAPDPHVSAGNLLQTATNRIIYGVRRFYQTRRAHPLEPEKWAPAFTAFLARETHVSALRSDGQTKIQISFSYSDGFGREIQKKIQAEPGTVPRRDAAGKIIVDTDGRPQVTAQAVAPRWVGDGWTVFNNKGQPVRQFEPFFTDTHRFEFDVRIGVSPVFFYDPPGRVVAVLHPNNTYEKVVFNPWQQETWDVNDTVLDDPRTDPDIKGYTAGYFTNLPPGARPTWHARRKDGALGLQEQNAAVKTAAHAGTPSTAHFDALGRPFLTGVHNKVTCPGHELDGTEAELYSRVELDIEGNTRAARDAVIQEGDAQGRVVLRYAYDMLGNRIYQLSMDAGARRLLNDVYGNPIHAWDSRGHHLRTEYDPLRRPARSYVTGADPADPGRELLIERLVYGEQHPEAVTCNLRGLLYLRLDQAGVDINEAHDFKGNLLRAARRLTSGAQYRQVVDWRAVDTNHLALPPDATAKINPAALEAELSPRLESEIYTTCTGYDALNRPVTLTTPHSPGLKPGIIRPGYNEANLLERVDVNLHGAGNGGQPVWTPFVTNIDYDAKGQCRRIDYGNKVSTLYEYDPFTFRLTSLLTRRDAVSFPGDCPQQPSAGWPGCQVQNLSYTYDPVGNITYIRDNAQQTVYFRNKRVEPDAAYTYDALYRLIEATGREHLGQNRARARDGTLKPPAPHSSSDAPRIGLTHPGDGNAVARYTEHYVYDAVGNFLQMSHRGNDPANPGWIRAYAYTKDSLIEPQKTGNRLTGAVINNGAPVTEHYIYDAHGNTTRMPHFAAHAHATAPNMRWDFQDRLRQVDLGGGGTAYYIYDAGGRRVRKVWEKSASLIEERIYLGIFEIYRRRQGMELLERETLHIMDNRRRIALVETRARDTAGADTAPPLLIRYQFGNHLGSAHLELDDQARVISYEEYFPYGNTSYQATRSQTETPKRYRYTGKERDEESGFYYHGARYYVPWLGRWSSCDPALLADGSNPYRYVRGNPIRLTDPLGLYSWREFGEDVLAGLAGAARGIVEPALIVMDFGQMGAALVTHAVTDDPEDLNVQFLSATGRRIAAAENPQTEGIRAGLVLATAIPTGGGSVLVDNVATVFERDMDPDEARRFLVRGAVGQTAVTGLGMGISRATGSGWTGRGSGSGDQALIERIVTERAARGETSTGRGGPSGRTYAVGRNARGRTTPVRRSPAEGGDPHAEPQALQDVGSSGGRTIAVDQAPCANCRSQLGAPEGRQPGFFDSSASGSLRVITPRRAANPAGSPKPAAIRAARALEQGGPGVELTPNVEFTVPYAPPVVPFQPNEPMSIDPYALTPAEIEMQQCLPEPERYF